MYKLYVIFWAATFATLVFIDDFLMQIITSFLLLIYLVMIKPRP